MNRFEFINWKKSIIEKSEKEYDFYMIALLPTVAFLFWTAEERAKYVSNFNSIFENEYKKACLFAC